MLKCTKHRARRYSLPVNGLTARWTFRLTEDGGLPPAPGSPISGPAGAPPLISRILLARGLSRPTEAATFLDPKLTQLHDPSLIPDLDKAAVRLVDAARRAEKIVIYGDYDVDGITATAILFHTLRAVAGTRTGEPNDNITTYVPHRLEEGYGLNSDAIRDLAAGGAQVIVSVDCGVTAIEPARVANELGIDLIITDHHNPPARISDLPEAFAVVHPRRPDSNYPFGELSGAGVAYKLAWRIATLASGGDGSNGARVSPEMRNLLVELLAFAALGTIADIVPLVGENRVLACYGLVRARKSPFIGLRALVEASGLTGENIGEMEVGFRLGPRLNAAGRMGHARDAVELFTVANEARAAEIAAHLSKQNEARRAVEREIFDLACQMAESAGMTGPDRRAIILAHESWHAGVVGIVCSRLVERFHRPTILMQKREGTCHGSGRSIDGFNLHAGLTHCAEHLDKYGGHNMAAGVHLVEPKLAAFTDAFTNYANSAIGQDMLCSHVIVDCEAAPEELTPETVHILQRLGPFGAGNPEVRLLVRGMTLADRRPMGAGGKHLQLSLRAPAPNTGAARIFRAVAWNWGERIDSLPPAARVDAVLKPRISTFTGNPTVEPEICDLAIKR